MISHNLRIGEPTVQFLPSKFLKYRAAAKRVFEAKLSDATICNSRGANPSCFSLARRELSATQRLSCQLPFRSRGNKFIEALYGSRQPRNNIRLQWAHLVCSEKGSMKCLEAERELEYLQPWLRREIALKK